MCAVKCGVSSELLRSCFGVVAEGLVLLGAGGGALHAHAEWLPGQPEEVSLFGGEGAFSGGDEVCLDALADGGEGAVFLFIRQVGVVG